MSASPGSPSGTAWAAALWAALLSGACPALAQDEEGADPAPTYEVKGPATTPGHKVSVEDSFESKLALGKNSEAIEGGFVQVYEDLYQGSKDHGNQLNVGRTWRSARDLSGQVEGDVAGFECNWGLGSTGLYWQQLQDHELPPLVAELLRAERDQAGCRQGSLDLPAGLAPAIPVQVGQTWDVDAAALARWGRLFYANLMIAQRSSARLAAVTEGESGPVLELRFKAVLTLAGFFPLGLEQQITRPTAVQVDVKLLVPTVWEVGGDAYQIQLKSKAKVILAGGKEYRVDHRWTRTVRRLE